MLFKRIREDIEAFKVRDPAARSSAEIVLCYPGFHAVLVHRASHALWRRGWHLLARLISHIGKILTAIEIHPGAEIGRRFVIDHGTGVVIGETAIIGDDVTLYQGVTLGGIAPSVNSYTQAGHKRHPTLLDGAIIGCGAAILGPVVVGEGARIGANAVVTKDVPFGVTAVGNPAQVVMPQNQNKARTKEFVAYGTPAEGCPDPVLQTIEALQSQLTVLSQRVEELASKGPPARTKTPSRPSDEVKDEPAVVVSRRMS
ncbi:MAG: serine O-acetyltransferase [Rhodospirillales bacterium]|nr:serine O-acetyltransferase [Rhodospirillales bacterium]